MEAATNDYTLLTKFTSALGELPVLFAPLVQKFREIEAAAGVNRLPTALVEQLYGRELRSSVSALEEFAACPFKFFTARGLRVEERKEFQFDDRDKGSFQHEILQEFHRQVVQAGRRWRDLTVAEASELIGDDRTGTPDAIRRRAFSRQRRGAVHRGIFN